MVVLSAAKDLIAACQGMRSFAALRMTAGLSFSGHALTEGIRRHRQVSEREAAMQRAAAGALAGRAEGDMQR